MMLSKTGFSVVLVTLCILASSAAAAPAKVPAAAEKDLLAPLRWIGGKSLGKDTFQVSPLPRKQYGIAVRKFIKLSGGKYLVQGRVNGEVRAVYISLLGRTKDDKPVNGPGNSAWLTGKQLIRDTKNNTVSFGAVLSFPAKDLKFSFLNFQTYSAKNVPVVIQELKLIPQID